MTEEKFCTKFEHRIVDILESINFESIKDGEAIIKAMRTFYALGLMDAKKNLKKKKKK